MLETLVYDQIPVGTFYAGGDLTPEQAATINHLERIGISLVGGQSDLLCELARDVDLRYKDIAEILIPNELEQFPEIAEKAVGFAIRQVIPDDELGELTHRRRSLRLKERILAMGDVAFLEHQRIASVKSWENRDRPDVDAMLEGRGRTAWSEEEKEMLQSLLENPEYQYRDGSHKGRPNYELIALELNISFHDCDGIRYSNSVRSMRNEFLKHKF